MNLNEHTARRLGGLPSVPAPLVFVVDDDLAVRESLNDLLCSAGWQAKVFASAEAFLAFARSPIPSCLVLDVTLPGLSGLGLQKFLANRAELPVIIITGNRSVPMAVEAMKAGAVEFLIKPFDSEFLLNAISAAVERSRSALRDAAATKKLGERYGLLSRREREVMELVVSGCLNKVVGGQLGISEITVKAHRGRVMKKMGAGSLPALVNMAATLGDRKALSAGLSNA